MDLGGPEPMELPGHFDQDQDMEMAGPSETQNVENEGAQVTQDCLNTPVVLEKLFQYFSNLELLQLSLVNKLWNYEARSLMKKRRDLTAFLLCGYDTMGGPGQEQLEAFGADLGQMNVAPYSEIEIWMISEGVGRETGALDSTFEAIRTRLQLKSLVVYLDGKWWNYKDCPALLLLKKLFQHFSGLLEELALRIEKKQEKFIEHFVSECSFANIKILELSERECEKTFSQSYTNYIKGLVSRAPKLQEIYTDGPIKLMENVMEGSSGVLMAQHEVCAPFHEISESAVHQLRLKEIKLFYTGPEFNLRRFNRMAPMLLQESCSTTLATMWLDPVLAVPLMCYGIRLENVSCLQMDFNYSLLQLPQGPILSIVKNFPFAQIFPNLKAIEIRVSFDYFEPSPDHMNTIIEQANAVLRAPVPDQAGNIKLLLFHPVPHQTELSATTLRFFAQMFPDIRNVYMTGFEEDEISSSIWNCWTDLELIQLNVNFLPNTEKFDSFLCGIFPEEVAHLREKDETFLGRVNIVPVMPAITCLKNLKVLDLHIGLDRERDWPLFFEFSQVSNLIAFARCPSLDVTIEWTYFG